MAGTKKGEDDIRVINMNEDLISVIIPVYNVEKYLDECITSVINQTYTNLEIIIVDDGSTDDSGDICEKYKSLDSRIKVIHKENGGLSSARNAGLKIATGKYVGFVDSDDYINSSMYEILYKAITDSNKKIACCDFFRFRTKDELPQNKTNIKKIVLDKVDSIRYMLSKDYFRFTSWNKLYLRTLFDDISFPEGKYFEDFWPIYNAFKESDGVIYIKDFLYYYRTVDDSISRAAFSLKDYDMIEALNLVDKDIRINFPNIICELSVSYSYYYLSFINKAIRASVKINSEMNVLSEYMKANKTYILNNNCLNLIRKFQFRLFILSPKIYYIFFRIAFRFR